MASSLGASFGVAISAAIFTALSADKGRVELASGRAHLRRQTGQRRVREAALFAFGANLLMIVAAIISIMLFVPKGKAREDPERSTPEQRAPRWCSGKDLNASESPSQVSSWSEMFLR